MRGLFGDFETMPLKDLVVYLGNKRATGVLGLEHDGTRKRIFVRDGSVVNASSNEPRELLGQFLINQGHITEEQFNRAYETQKETKIFLGRILVMTGAVDESTLKNSLNLKVRETLLQAFHWTDGSFSFQPDAVPDMPDGMDLSVDLMDVHREGEFRETAWQAIRAAFPSGSDRLLLEERNLPDAPNHGSLDAKLLKLIREGQTIDEMILALHATDFYVYQRLYALYRLEVVRVQESHPIPPVPAVPPVAAPSDQRKAEWMAQAEILLAQGEYLEAEVLARRAHDNAPTAATAALLGKCESELLGHLRQDLMRGRVVPTVLLAPQKLRSMQLSAPERYLLSKVDGRRDVASIVQVSPLHELEALKHFKRFVISGWVELQREE